MNCDGAESIAKCPGAQMECLSVYLSVAMELALRSQFKYLCVDKELITEK